jgi:hypothetical protein
MHIYIIIVNNNILKVNLNLKALSIKEQKVAKEIF